VQLEHLFGNMESAIREVGRTGLRVSFIGFGALEIGRDWGIGGDTRRPSETAAREVLNHVLDLGICLIDTASAYHKSEMRIGKYISHRRDEFVLASKCGEHNREPETYYDFSYKAVKASIDKSLDLLRTDVIDIMQIHFGPDPEKVLRDGETVAAMQDAQREGKIRFLGASPPAHLIEACIHLGVFQVLQVEYNVLNREAEQAIQTAHKAGLGIFIRSGFAGGYLTPRVETLLKSGTHPRLEQVRHLLKILGGKVEWLPALALQFLYRNPAVTSVLVGTKSIKHLDQNLRLLSVNLPKDVWEKMENV